MPRERSPDKGPSGRPRHRLLVLLLAVAGFLILDLISHKPGVSGFFILALVGAALAGSEWWNYQEKVRALRRRIRRTIVEILSDGRSRDRKEITREIRLRIRPLRHPTLLWLRLQEDALEEMTRRGLLAFHEGKYSVVEDAALWPSIR
jgi:hypothetical protein